MLACCSSGGCSPAPANEPLPLSELKAYRACQTDEQCVWVQNGCCDCANDGEDIAVARDKQAAFRALFSCKGVGCTEVAREPPCGTGTVACERGLCVFREAR
jgi:hypothetical protein